MDEELHRRLDELSEEQFQRLYGPWRDLVPDDAAELLAGLDAPWWIAGGWAIEAFSGVARPHGDLDVCVLEDDVPAVIEHFGTTHHVWAAGSGFLYPLLAPEQQVPDETRQLWVREDAGAPWLLDLLITPSAGDRWAFHRDTSVVEDLDRVVWTAPDGIRYLRPEWALASKAALARPKDLADLEVVLPLLDHNARSRLAEVLHRVDPGHDWLDRLTGTNPSTDPREEG